MPPSLPFTHRVRMLERQTLVNVKLGGALRMRPNWRLQQTTRQCLRGLSDYSKRPKDAQSISDKATSPRSRAYEQYMRIVKNISKLGPIRLMSRAFGAFILWHIATSYFYDFRQTYGISMLPTLDSCGDWVLISKYYRRGRGIQVGDLVSFSHPSEEGVQAVKRVVGLEGDFVGVGPSFVGDDGTPIGQSRGGMMIQIPKGHCWVVGDNLKHSRDSRLFGPLPLALIRGKITARAGSLTDIAWVHNGLQDGMIDQD